MIGYFEGTESQQGGEWRCTGSLALMDFLSRCRIILLVEDQDRLPHEGHEEDADWVLSPIAKHGLLKADPIGVDASTMGATALASDRMSKLARDLPENADPHGQGERHRDSVHDDHHQRVARQIKC